MRKISLIGLAMLIVSIPTFAGDYLTNTNQNAAFLRMIARGASIDVDGVYSNPAGLAFLPKEAGACPAPPPRTGTAPALRRAAPVLKCVLASACQTNPSPPSLLLYRGIPRILYFMKAPPRISHNPGGKAKETSE